MKRLFIVGSKDPRARESPGLCAVLSRAPLATSSAGQYNHAQRTSSAACLAALIALACQVPGSAQDSSDSQSSAGAGTSTGAPFVLNVPRGNPLEGLFTPQPQYPGATSLMNPEATPPPAGELNPLKGLFTPQPQYVTPQALPNPDGRPPDGETNHFKGMFTPPNQWATPQTILNPHAEPRSLVPERQFLWGSDEDSAALLRQHFVNTYGSERSPQAVPEEKAAGGKGAKESSRQPTPKVKQSSVGPEKTDPAKPVSESPHEKQPSPLRDALSCMASSDYEKSVQVIDRFLLENPNDAQAHYLRAVALVKLRRYENAAAEYKQVLHIRPGDRLGDLARNGLKKLGSAP